MRDKLLKLMPQKHHELFNAWLDANNCMYYGIGLLCGVGLMLLLRASA